MELVWINEFNESNPKKVTSACLLQSNSCILVQFWLMILHRNHLRHNDGSCLCILEIPQLRKNNIHAPNRIIVRCKLKPPKKNGTDLKAVDVEVETEGLYDHCCSFTQRMPTAGTQLFTTNRPTGQKYKKKNLQPVKGPGYMLFLIKKKINGGCQFCLACRIYCHIDQGLSVQLSWLEWVRWWWCHILTQALFFSSY